MDSNGLKLNDSKSEFVLLGSPQMLSKVKSETIEIRIGNNSIKPSNIVCNLGVIYDSNLSMAMCSELATRSVTSPDSENFAPLELQDSLTWEFLALPYQKYTLSERKFHEELKYGIKRCRVKCKGFVTNFILILRAKK